MAGSGCAQHPVARNVKYDPPQWTIRSFTSLPALAAETNGTHPAARGRAEALVIAHALEIAADAVRSYLAALDASDFDTVDVDPLVEAASDAEGAAIFVVCDCAEALASAHRGRGGHVDQANGE